VNFEKLRMLSQQIRVIKTYCQQTIMVRGGREGGRKEGGREGGRKRRSKKGRKGGREKKVRERGKGGGGGIE